MTEEGGISRFLVGAYSSVRKTGLLDRDWFQRLFSSAYFLYKRHIEDPYFALLKAHPEIVRRGHVLDVGANIGYTATLFARALDPGFRVYAFEPEPSNFNYLRQNIERRGIGSRVVTVQAAVGERSGLIQLWRNVDHHGDHRVFTSRLRESGADAAKSIPVAMTTIDQFVAEHGLRGQICFIKIDVQGYELPVCQGLEKTLADNPRLVIALEYMPQAMIELGLDPSELLAFFRDRDYRVHLVFGRGRGKGTIQQVSDEELSVAVRGKGYVDILASRQAL